MPKSASVSQRYSGSYCGIAPNCPGGPEAVLNQPSMSIATLIEPVLFQMVTVPLEDTGTMTWLFTVASAGALRLEAKGRAEPPGYAVRTVGAVGPMAVRAKDTALTPDAGTGLPDAWTLNVR